MYRTNSLVTYSLILLVLLPFYRCQTTEKQTSHTLLPHHSPDLPDLSKKVSIADAHLVLQHFVHGSVPEFAESPTNSPRQDVSLLSKPEYCFAKCFDTDPADCDPYIAFRNNIEAFVIPFATAVQELELSARVYLNEEQTVEQWIYGDLWMVIVNYGAEDFLYESTLIPQYGFIAIGPHYLAQHYYPNANDKTTRLLVHYEDRMYTGMNNGVVP